MSQKCIQITFSPVESLDNETMAFLESYFDVVACNYTDSGLEEYVGYISPNFIETDFLAMAESFNLPHYKISTLESENWLKDYVIEFDPIEIEDFYIFGIHEKNEPKTKKIPIKIYAATAFGSSHQTTKCCLQALTWLHRQNAKHKKTLDVGTGTGILSIAAAKLWNDTQILATDIDDEAVIVANQNAETNRVGCQITAIRSDGYTNPHIKTQGPFDIILSNILARPLIEMSNDLYKNLTKNGYCVLSGFNEEQFDWVVSEHEKQGLKLIKTYHDENWRAVIMEKV